jgi:hypothetical protein
MEGTHGRSGGCGQAEARVKSHVARVLAKLSLLDRVQIAVFAYEKGMSGQGGRSGRNATRSARHQPTVSSLRR